MPSGATEVFADDVAFAMSASGDGGPGGCPYQGSGGMPPLGEGGTKIGCVGICASGAGGKPGESGGLCDGSLTSGKADDCIVWSTSSISVSGVVAGTGGCGGCCC